jgi:hypothetical protein
MDLKTFLAATYNVYESKHESEFIYVGHDPANQWSAFLKGEEKDLGLVDTLEQAQAAAHRLYDEGLVCGLKLEWRLLSQTVIKDWVE